MTARCKLKPRTRRRKSSCGPRPIQRRAISEWNRSVATTRAKCCRNLATASIWRKSTRLSPVWSAYFVELTYDVGAPTPLKVTTEVKVTPEIVPFADRDPSQPASVTVVAAAKSDQDAEQIIAEFPQVAEQHSLGKVLSEALGAKVFLNFVPSGERPEKQVGGIIEWLKAKGCDDALYQLESGQRITLPPALVKEAVSN